jgi:hypothetical protein
LLTHTHAAPVAFGQHTVATGTIPANVIPVRPKTAATSKKDNEEKFAAARVHGGKLHQYGLGDQTTATQIKARKQNNGTY